MEKGNPIPPEKLQAAMQALEQIQTILSRSVFNPDNQEFNSKPETDKSLDSNANRILEELLDNLGISLTLSDVEEHDMDSDPESSLLSIFHALKELQEKLEDTMNWHRSKAYLFALSYHNSVKEAAKANVPGAKEINDELNKILWENNPDGDS
jgi:hypothetical protein